MPLKIIGQSPRNWRDLQDLASTILINCGFTSEVEKNIQTARGAVEVDVYAEKDIGYKFKILCECKYWKKAVPKFVVHAFRTVLVDFGAGQGFIISNKGFNTGAYEAAKNTNISLLSWDEFEDTFKDGFLKNIIERNAGKGRVTTQQVQ